MPPGQAVSCLLVRRCHDHTSLRYRISWDMLCSFSAACSALKPLGGGARGRGGARGFMA